LGFQRAGSSIPDLVLARFRNAADSGNASAEKQWLDSFSADATVEVPKWQLLQRRFVGSNKTKMTKNQRPLKTFKDLVVPVMRLMFVLVFALSLVASLERVARHQDLERLWLKAFASLDAYCLVKSGTCCFLSKATDV
jgi:hypothetical protein